MNRVTSNGSLLKAQRTIIVKTDCLYTGLEEGINAGNLLLWHSMDASQNGLQMQRNKPVTINSLKKGKTVIIDNESLSSNQHCIASVNS